MDSGSHLLLWDPARDYRDPPLSQHRTCSQENCCSSCFLLLVAPAEAPSSGVTQIASPLSPALRRRPRWLHPCRPDFTASIPTGDRAFPNNNPQRERGCTVARCIVLLDSLLSRNKGLLLSLGSANFLHPEIQRSKGTENPKPNTPFTLLLSYKPLA